MKNLRQKCLGFLQNNQWALMTGLLTGTSYIPLPPWALLFNFVPLWWHWTQKAQSRKDVFWSGWWSQFILNLIGFHWIFHTAYEFGHIPAPISLVVLLLFAALAHLYIPLVGLLFFEIQRRVTATTAASLRKSPRPVSIGLLLVLTGLWALAEIYWPYIFQWHMGYTLLWAKLPIYHFADVIGFQGLSYLLLLFNGFFIWNLSRTPHEKKNSPNPALTQGLQTIGVAAAVFLLLNGAGWIHGRQWTQKKPAKLINFLPVQANIGNAEKIMAERGYGYQDFITQRFIELSQKALQKHPETDFLVWPESAIPDYLDADFAMRRRPQLIRRFLTQTQKYLITGAYSKEFAKPTSPTPNEENSFNALFILNPQGNAIVKPYRKKHLLAFGEYTPFADWFPQLNDISPSGKGFSRGPGAQTLALPQTPQGPLRVAPQICYEGLFPEFSRKGVLEGAQILINVTNDSWFGPFSEPYQHLSMTFARAIENRRPLLRVTNTGFTSAIEASGKILNHSPLYQEWSEPLTLGYDENPPMTLYTRYGGFWPFGVLVLALGGLASVTYNRSKQKRKTEPPLT
jgi:apolipoprotein N-acyltransferase